MSLGTSRKKAENDGEKEQETNRRTRPRRKGQLSTGQQVTDAQMSFLAAVARNLEELYNAFETEVDSSKSSEAREESCTATLSGFDAENNELSAVTGDTHAEMEVLQKLYDQNEDLSFVKGAQIETSTPSCLMCSAVQGLLGIKGKGGKDQTLYSSMKGTIPVSGKGWKMPAFLKDNDRLLKAFLGEKEVTFKERPMAKAYKTTTAYGFYDSASPDFRKELLDLVEAISCYHFEAPKNRRKQLQSRFEKAQGKQRSMRERKKVGAGLSEEEKRPKKSKGVTKGRLSKKKKPWARVQQNRLD